MTKLIQFLKIFFIFYVTTLSGCKTNNFPGKENIFAKASKADSLAYYFPAVLSDTFVARHSEYQDFEQKWYSSSLYSFKEPILYNKIDSQTIYRLLWLRSFDRPVCFSVKEFDGNYFLDAKTLDRQPEFFPTILRHIDTNTRKETLDTIQKADRFALIAYDSVTILTSWRWNEIENYISKLDFWNSPIADPNNNYSNDGSNWIIEARKNKKYHFINRRNATGDLKALGKYLIGLSGLQIKDRAIY